MMELETQRGEVTNGPSRRVSKALAIKQHLTHWAMKGSNTSPHQEGKIQSQKCEFPFNKGETLEQTY